MSNLQIIKEDLIAGKQHFRCANKPNSISLGLNGYDCPLWKLIGDDRGIFDESNYIIDNNQALCRMCHYVKIARFTDNMAQLPDLRESILKKAKHEIHKEKERDDEYRINGCGQELKYNYDKLREEINGTDNIDEINKIANLYFNGDPNEFEENSIEC